MVCISVYHPKKAYNPVYTKWCIWLIYIWYHVTQVWRLKYVPESVAGKICTPRHDKNLIYAPVSLSHLFTAYLRHDGFSTTRLRRCPDCVNGWTYFRGAKLAIRKFIALRWNCTNFISRYELCDIAILVSAVCTNYQLSIIGNLWFRCIDFVESCKMHTDCGVDSCVFWCVHIAELQSW